MKPEHENQLTLARILNIPEEEASHRLSHRVAISGADGAPAFASEVAELLARTLTMADSGETDVEIVISGEPRTDAQTKVFVSLSENEVIVANEAPANVRPVKPLLAAIAACYVASAVIDRATLLNRGVDPFVVRFKDLGITDELLNKNVVLENPTLAGAGAIGNGFLRALRHLNVSGSLTISDPKDVSEGNQNRCLYFTESSVGKRKANELCTRAQGDFANLQLIPYDADFSSLVKNTGKIRTVIVATDSRRVRRTIQSELPLEVIDASTTGSDEIIIHSHHQPTTGACLACVYKHVPDELSRERTIAAELRVDLADVQKPLIDVATADKIARAYPQITRESILGKAIDSLFRELCASQALKSPEGEQVFAPFAFISNLAGALLAIELMRVYGTADDPATNYFAISPWRPPNPMMRRRRPKVPECEVCSKKQFAEAMSLVWGDEAA